MISTVNDITRQPCSTADCCWRWCHCAPSHTMTHHRDATPSPRRVQKQPSHQYTLPSLLHLLLFQMFDIISIVGLVIAFALFAVLVPCCPLSVVCPPLCVFTLPVRVWKPTEYYTTVLNCSLLLLNTRQFWFLWFILPHSYCCYWIQDSFDSCDSYCLILTIDIANCWYCFWLFDSCVSF